MRVVFLTQDDPLYILPFFESFFAQDIGKVEVTSIFACRAMGNRKRTKLVRELLLLYGPFGFAKLLGLQCWMRAASVVGLESAPSRSYSFKALARAHRIPYHRIGNPNHSEHFALIAAQRPDALVSVACPFLLKRPLLELPSYAALNIHHAPLPRYKGMMPTFWQMYHGESSVGITIHTMVEKLDAGEIVYQKSVPIVAGRSMHQLIRYSKRAGARAMMEVLQQYAQGQSPTPIVPVAESSYFTFPRPDEMRTFRKRGLRAI